VLFSTWPAYALVGAGALGTWLTQNAFSAGPLQASLPAISAGEPLIGILLGVIVFGDRIQISPGLLAIQAGGVAALVVGVVMVASDPALSQLREQASKLRSAVRDTASQEYPTKFLYDYRDPSKAQTRVPASRPGVSARGSTGVHRPPGLRL